jgi:dihydrofolate reductase
MEAGLVDEVIVKLNPILFGTGIPLFARRLQTTQLELLEDDVYPSGHMLLRYGVRANG